LPAAPAGGGPAGVPGGAGIREEGAGIREDTVSVVRLIAVRESALSAEEVLAAVEDPAAGGVALFAGAVRDSDGGRRVTALSYTAHPTAAAELRRVAEQVAQKFPVRAIAAVHRVGDLRTGDLAVVVAASCPHRAEAFDACRALIDELKASVPIWKHQRFADGSAEWVGSP
jgi:molybdopterin synthase catalytic subunit